MKNNQQEFWTSFNERDDQGIYTWWRWWMGPFLVLVLAILGIAIQ